MRRYQSIWTASAGLVLTLLGVSALADPAANEKKVLPAIVAEQAGHPAVPSASPFDPTPTVAAAPVSTPRRVPRQGFARGRLRGKLRGLFQRGNP